MKNLYISLISLTLCSCYAYEYPTVNSQYCGDKRPIKSSYESRYKWQSPQCKPYKSTYSHGCKHCQQGIPHNWCTTGQSHHNGLYHDQSRRMSDYKQYYRH